MLGCVAALPPRCGGCTWTAVQEDSDFPSWLVPFMVAFMVAPVFGRGTSQA